jgi:DNA excision repair protein ERCC-4
MNKPCAFPGVVLVDTREQLPYLFDAIRADKREGGGVLAVPTRVEGLPSGDYSLDGFADRVAVERKSPADLFGTLGKGRERFDRELARLADMEFAAVVVEAEWTEIVNNPPARSQLPPRTVFRSVLAWQQRYPRVHWWTVPGRAMGEVVTFRILERFHREQSK